MKSRLLPHIDVLKDYKDLNPRKTTKPNYGNHKR